MNAHETEEAVVSELKALEERRNAALVAADSETFDSLFADDAVVYHGAGTIERGKAGFIPNLARRLEIRESATRDVACRVHGDIAIMTGRHEMVVRQKLKPGTDFYPANALMTSVWERIGGQWRIVHQHQTRIPPDLSPK